MRWWGHVILWGGTQPGRRLVEQPQPAASGNGAAPVSPRRPRPGSRTARTAMCGPQWATGGPMSGTVTYRGKLRGWAVSSRACRSRDDQAL